MAEEELRWQPRDYQQQAHDAVLREFIGGTPSTLVQMPTGTGKTVVAATVAKTAYEVHNRRTLFLAHREILILQAAETIADIDLHCAIEMGAQDARAINSIQGIAPCVVGTVQTLSGTRLERWPRDHFGLIITDECHRAAAPSHQEVYRWFNEAWHLGITATPDGASGRIGLNEVYRSEAYRYSIKQAVLDGYLVRPKREKCMLQIDLRGIRVSGGDFNVGDLAERISPSISVLADAIKQRIGKRFAVVFTPDVGSALSLAAALGNDTPSGGPVAARYVSGDNGRFGMSRRERNERLKEFAAQKLQVLVNCDLLFEGWDARHISAVVIARPTRQRYRFAQMLGRGLRICPEIGKEDCLLIDFDWQCDEGSRDVVTPIEFFAHDDDEFNHESKPAQDRILESARGLARIDYDPFAALEEAKHIERNRASMPVFLSGMKAQFAIEHYDPLAIADLCGFKLTKRHDFVRPGFQAAYPGQIKRLKELGVVGPEKLSMFGASKLLRELERRGKLGLSSYSQIHALVNGGVHEADARLMRATQASAMLETLK